MNDTNLALLEKNRDILSIRDLATGTIATYTSYLTNYINWVEENLPGRSLSDITWEEIRSYEKYLKDVCKCGKCGGKTIVLCRGKPQSGLLLYSELLEKFEQSSAE